MEILNGAVNGESSHESLASERTYTHLQSLWASQLASRKGRKVILKRDQVYPCGGNPAPPVLYFGRDENYPRGKKDD